MEKQQSPGKSRLPDSNNSYTLYDNILNDVAERQLESNLANFIQSRRLYESIVAAGKEKIDQEFHERKKVIDGKGRIHKSSLINQSHMMKNELRHKMCQQIFAAVLHRIQSKIEQDQDEYCLILVQLIVEGALRMFEPELYIRCLSKHRKAVERVLEAAQETFNYVMVEQTGRNYPIKLRLNTSDALKERVLNPKTDHEDFTKKQEDQECIGGIILSDKSGNITYKNTIDTRVSILRQISLPILRTELWPSYAVQDTAPNANTNTNKEH